MAGRLPSTTVFRLGQREIDLDHHVAVMAVVNRTPDSFAVRHPDLGPALERALAAVEEGADLVDVGGVKAGPGADVDVHTELRRVLPLIEALRAASGVAISVDTYRAEVARQALAAGADLVNDVSGLSEPGLAEAVAANPGAGLVVLHAGGQLRGRPHRASHVPDVVTVVRDELVRLVALARRHGVDADRIVVDPGHDFGKNTLHSLELTRRIHELCDLGHPVLVALSRKDFLGEALGGVGVDERLEASLAAAVLCAAGGARIVRVHDVGPTVRALRTTEVLLGLRPPGLLLRGLE